MNKKLQRVLPSFLCILFLVFVFPNIAASQTTGTAHNQSFRDDFSMQSIKPNWRIVNKDPDRYSLIDNQYLMLVTKKPAVNIFTYDTFDLPENFLAEIKIDDAPIQIGQGFSLRLSQDANNYINLYMYVGGYNQGHAITSWLIVFEKTLKGETTKYGPVEIKSEHFGPNEKMIIKENSLKLAIRKNEVEYAAFYSIGNSSWQEIGSHLFLNLKGVLQFASYNWLDNVPESPVKVDYFELKELN